MPGYSPWTDLIEAQPDDHSPCTPTLMHALNNNIRWVRECMIYQPIILYQSTGCEKKLFTYAPAQHPYGGYINQYPSGDAMNDEFDASTMSQTWQTVIYKFKLWVPNWPEIQIASFSIELGVSPAAKTVEVKFGLNGVYSSSTSNTGGDAYKTLTLALDSTQKGNANDAGLMNTLNIQLKVNDSDTIGFLRDACLYIQPTL